MLGTAQRCVEGRESGLQWGAVTGRRVGAVECVDASNQGVDAGVEMGATSSHR